MNEQKTLPNIKSPTGCAHRIGTDYSQNPDIADEYKHLATTMCNYNKGWGYGGWLDAYDVDWPRTDEPITCKNCLAATEREAKQNG